MALILKDRVKETSASSGTGNITLTGAFPGYQTFNSVIASGSTVYYTIHNINPGHDTEWEVGVGTFTSPATLARNTVLSSSNSGALVPFTSGAGGLEVFVTQPAEEAVYINQATGKVEAFGNGANSISFNTVVADNVTLTAGTITTNASNATDITNKQYVDGLFSTGISYHDPVLVESPTALNAVYVQPNGAGNGVGATLTNNGANVALVIDGVSLSNTARVLVYTQANAVQNGIYTVTNPGAPDPGGSKWVLTRATDADTYGLADPNALGQGDAVFIQSGNTGAGETYVCNTPGTITFGTTNITFAQISTAQIYTAGTGLNLSNLTFNIANTAVTAATYGAANAVGTFTVNAQGQITNAANTTISIASSQINDAIPNSGLANSNVVVNGTTINLGGSGTITANTTGTLTIGSYLTGGSFNGGSNVTVAVDGNSSNSANTVVVRDANGAFAGGNITAANFIGDGTAITAINASNISSGTIANARTTAASANGASTIVQRDAGGNFSANTITANISGDISGGTNINASNITSGTINNARTTASSANGASTIVLRDVNGSFDANVVNATNLSGGGTSITSMNASNLSAGTVASARISGSYTGITGVGTVTAGTWQGNVIATTYGGTNLSSFTTNGVVYASSTTALATSSGFVFDGTNVGIGTTDGGIRLRVREDSTSTTDVKGMYLQNANFTTNTQVGLGFLNADNFNAKIYSLRSGSSAGNIVFATNGGGGTAESNVAERMRIDSSGNLLVGTASTLNSGLVLNNASNYFGLRLAVAGSIQGQIIQESTGNIYLDAGTTNTGGSLIFRTNSGTERMRIDSSGNVGIGTTSPTAVLTVRTGGSSSGTLSLAAATGGGGGSAIVMGNADSGGTAGPSVINASNRTITFGLGNSFTSASGGTFTEYMRMSADGGFSVGTTSSPGAGAIYATGNITAFFSDKRLKTVSGKIENALDKVNSLSGVYYTMNDVAKSHGYDSDETHVGVLAQEVEAVLPEIVKPAPFDLDENNNSKSGENYKTVQYEKLVPLLIEAIKELKAEVDALKAKG